MVRVEGIMSNIIGITLARGGSKGVPGKHTRILCGKPVIAWTIEEVLKSKLIEQYAVSSDSDDILDVARQYNVMAIKRPIELARDNTPTLPALLHAVDYMGSARYVAEIRATSPLKTVEDIDGVVWKLIENNADSAIGVTLMQDHHPSRMKWMDHKDYLHDFIPEPRSGRRQDCTPTAYIRNGTVYALKTPIRKLFGHRCSIGYVIPEERSINIDTEIDYKLCEILMKERLQCFG